MADDQPPIGREFVEWLSGACPDCGSPDFELGPRAAVCVNVECRRCGSRFNIARLPDRTLIQRIDRPRERKGRALTAAYLGPAKNTAAPVLAGACRNAKEPKGGAAE